MSETVNSLDSEKLEQNISTGIEQVERLLEDSLSGSRRGVIDDLAVHLCKAGGKRIRPALVLLCAHLGSSGINSQVLKAAVVVELTHLATLYHDDVMDSAPTRRGVESAHMLWGNNRAILAGDLVFAKASSLCAELGTESVRQHAVTFERLCDGQLNETFGPLAEDNRVDFYIQVLADKTGSLVAQAARFGAMHGGASAEEAEMVSQFGEKVGVAFQLADDVIDLASDGEVSGKTPGTDLREGVDTMPTLLLREADKAGKLADDPLGKEIMAALSSGRLGEDEELVQKTISALREHWVLEHTRELARSWANEAKEAISGLPDTVVKQALLDFADNLVQRMA